ncbi:MAG: nitrilase-related carbon-nitrogen hydrolase [Ilumatobacteraceae bacterium]
MRFAAVQHDIEWCERDRNFARLAERIDDAVARGAGFVLLSETFSTGFAVDDPRFAEPEGGPSSSFLVEQAVRHGAWIGGTCPEVPSPNEGDPRPANTFVVAAPDGTTSRYRKIHPFTYGGEDAHVRPGRDFVTVKVGDLRVSLFVCYDLRFADEFWALARDTDVYLVPANWPSSRREHWMALLRARAIENQAWVIGCNRVGEGGGLSYGGDSLIIDPYGEVVARGDDTETTLFADVTAARVTEIRERFRFLQDRR